MNRYPTERLMTVEEAQRLSDLETSHAENEKRRRMWAWQSVAGAMAQTVDDETLDKMEALRLR
jgi:siroheme synthase (precorrin-2 oxidase/ferrochelatase)